MNLVILTVLPLTQQWNFKTSTTNTKHAKVNTKHTDMTRANISQLLYLTTPYSLSAETKRSAKKLHTQFIVLWPLTVHANYPHQSVYHISSFRVSSWVEDITRSPVHHLLDLPCWNKMHYSPAKLAPNFSLDKHKLNLQVCVNSCTKIINAILCQCLTMCKYTVQHIH